MPLVHAMNINGVRMIASPTRHRNHNDNRSPFVPLSPLTPSHMSKERSILCRTIDEEYAFRMMLSCSSGQYSEQVELLRRLTSSAHMMYTSRRPILIEWLAEICLHFGIRSLTLHIAVRLMDMFVFSIPWSSSLSPLYALTCLYTASKYDEADNPTPPISEWECVGEAGCSAHNIRSMEVILLSALQWNLGYKTPVHYLLEYMSVLCRVLAVGNDDGDHSSNTKDLSEIWNHEPFLNSTATIADAYDESDDEISDLSDEDCEREGNRSVQSFELSSPDSPPFIETVCKDIPDKTICSQPTHQNSSHSELLKSYRVAADLLDLSLLHPVVYLSHAPQTLAASALLIGSQITGGSLLPVDGRVLCAGSSHDLESSTCALMNIMGTLSRGREESTPGST